MGMPKDFPIDRVTETLSFGMTGYLRLPLHSGPVPVELPCCFQYTIGQRTCDLIQTEELKLTRNSHVVESFRA